MKSPLTKEQFEHEQAKCYKNNIKPIMEEIKNLGKQLHSFELDITKDIAEMPEKLEVKFDDRYADKHTESEVKKINTNITWLVRVVIGAVVAQMLILVLK